MKSKIFSYLNQCPEENVSDSEQLHIFQYVEGQKGTEAPTGTPKAFIAKREKKGKKLCNSKW
jgi:hypothetical protein